MDPTQALHTAARRYCTQKHSHWVDEYTKLPNEGRAANDYDYTPEALNIFPRYNVLKAILNAVEKLVPSDFGSVDEARKALIATGQDAQSPFTEDPSCDIEQSAIAEERTAFCAYIANITDTALAAVAPLPYERVLQEEESKRLWGKLGEVWDVTEHHWFPLTDCARKDILAFQDRYFMDACGPEKLIPVLRSREIEKVWVLREIECDPQHEVEISLFDPCYRGSEEYWTSEKMDWIIYVSHESSVTVGGWLLDEVKRLWTQWQDHIWESPFFE